MAMMNVEIISKEIIKPSSPTPHHLRTHKLSFLDQFPPTTYIPIILFYHANNAHEDVDHHVQKSNRLRKSLIQTLNRFYPLSGTVKEDHSIDCNDEGVEFYEAKVACKLSRVLQHFNTEILNPFLPFQPYGSHEVLLLAVKYNIFECGGVAVGVCVSHRIADGASATTFLGAWSATSRLGDLLCASLMLDPSGQLAFDVYSKYIIDHGARGPFSPRVQKIFIFCAESINFQTLKKVKKVKFVELLNHLCIGIKDVWNTDKWITILLEIIKSPNGVHKLAISSWELLAELAIFELWVSRDTYSPDVTASLLVAEEWDKLKCWMGIAWIVQANNPDDITEDLNHATATLLHHQPGAVQKLMQWMKQWSEGQQGRIIPDSFHQIHKQACEEIPDIGLLKLITQ